jgi:hypothetical protein
MAMLWQTVRVEEEKIRLKVQQASRLGVCRLAEEGVV